MSGLRFTEADLATMTAKPVKPVTRMAFAAPKVFHREISEPAPVKKPKYSNQPQEVGGEKYRSKRELKRHRELLMLQEAGKIQNLQREVPFVLVPTQRKQDGKTERGVVYVADFVYDHFPQGFRQVCVEDSKGMRTKEYIIKRKLMLQKHGIEIVEV